MNASLPNELHNFCGHAVRLRQVFEETRKCFDDINLSANFDGTQIITAELLKEEETEIIQAVKRSPSFVVFGQNPYAKSRIVNELFGRSVLPLFEHGTGRNDDIVMVRFKQSHHASAGTLQDLEHVGSLQTDQNDWTPLQAEDLIVPAQAKGDVESSTLEVVQDHPLLRFGAQVTVAPSRAGGLTEKLVKACVNHTPCVLLYGFATDQLHDKDVQDLSEIGKVTSFQPIAFVRVPLPGSRTVDTDPADGAPASKHGGKRDVDSGSLLSKSLGKTLRLSLSGDSGWGSDPSATSVSSLSAALNPTGLDLHQQLCRLGYLPGEEDESQYRHTLLRDHFKVESIFIERFHEFLPQLSTFTGQTLQGYLVNAATVLNSSHTRCLKVFILSAFDMARDMVVTPKRLEFAREKEEELYKSLLATAVSKTDEIRDLISETIIDISYDVQEDAAEFDFSCHGIEEDGPQLSSQGIRFCTEMIQDMVLSRLSSHVAGKLLSSVNVLRESFTGTLTRCLESLEGQTESPQDANTTDALKKILTAAYQVEITVRSSSSLIQTLLEKMKQLMMTLPWKTPPQLTTEWKRKVATDMLSSLSEARLARTIAGQIKERLTQSHEAFGGALAQLQERHSGRLDRMEDQRKKLRKVHAPRLAKLALESTSLRDTVLHGMPTMGREIGRGQYGVVYACDSWAGYSPVAIKSVVPPDDKHWNDLALEFFYTKNLPLHPRLVSLRGSVVDYMYGGGTSPAVLLVMDRLHRDLYAAIKQGLDWLNRLQVAIDVVEGLRFLHGQGLVHRDIKLKNVLLDQDNRGKITDLGFCKPEAMMSGSIVGTPIHMAPELFSGSYDNSVDVYAFGILFWYLCAGHVRLPAAFEQCSSKDQLWQAVKKGLRPERLPEFSEKCWQLMQKCWQKEAAKRPYLGDVQTRLSSLRDHTRKRTTQLSTSIANSRGQKSSFSKKISAKPKRVP